MFMSLIVVMLTTVHLTIERRMFTHCAGQASAPVVVSHPQQSEEMLKYSYIPNKV